MKTHLLFTIITLIVLAFTACRSTQHSPDTYTGKQLHFGSGGGFTGAVTTWCLLEDGQLYKKEELRPGEGTFAFVKHIKKKTTRQIFEKATELNLQQIDFQHPGNMYTFVAIGDSESQHRITWGADTPKVEAPILDFFESLQALRP